MVNQSPNQSPGRQRVKWEAPMLTPFNEELAVDCRFADRYQILSVVGRGSMGVVYKARHELMGRLVAIKMLRGQLQLDERSVRRFEREARAASRMDHPNLISVHDFGLTENRQPYLIMDYANGVTLYEIQRREGALTPTRAVHIFSQVCDALHHAHVQGVIHRDLKPSNIMILSKDDDPDYVKVFDLGVAKIAWGNEEDKEAITNTGEVCGSPVYLSPEQCTHQALDPRTDIYSLGVVMYELLTGMPPLMGETVYDTIYMHVHMQPPTFMEMRPDMALPPRLERIILKALEKNPDDRYQTMQELKWELLAALETVEPNLRVLPPEALNNLRKRSPVVSAPAPEQEKDKATGNVRISQATNVRISQSGMPVHHKGVVTEALRSTRDNIRSTSATLQATTDRLRAQLNIYISPVSAAVISSIASVIITLGAMCLMNAVMKKPATATAVDASKMTIVASPSDTLPSVTNGSANGSAATLPTKTAEATPTAFSKWFKKSSHPLPASTAKLASKPFPRVLRPTAGHQSDTKVATSTAKAVPASAQPKAELVADRPAKTAPQGPASFFSIFNFGGNKSPGPADLSPMPRAANHPQNSAPAKGNPNQATAAAPLQNGGNGEGEVRPALAHQGVYQPQATYVAQNGGGRHINGTGTSPLIASAGAAGAYGHHASPGSDPSPNAIPPPSNDQSGFSYQASQDNASAIDRKREAALLNNAAVASITDDPAQAIQKLQSALRIDPEYKRAKQNLGRAYLNNANRLRGAGDTQGAMRDYKLAVQTLQSALGSSHPDTQAAQTMYNDFVQSNGH